MEGFNYALVGGVWGGVFILVVGITIYRIVKEKKE
jgi:hypothetical protein